MEVDRQRDALRIVRTVFGLPRARLAVRLGDVVDVGLERGPVGDDRARAGQSREWGGRLVLVLRDGSKLPVSARMLRGPDVLERSFAALRGALELPAVAPPARVVPPRFAAPTTGRRKWLPVLVVLGVAGGGAAVATLYARAREPRGRLELFAQTRCSFRGMDLLPGGRLELSLPPGEYPLRVWSADLPGHWEPQTVRIRQGMTTFVTCGPEW